MSSSAPLKIPLEEIESITKSFSNANFIGESFLGKIYGGQLSVSGELIDVAVRRLDHSFWLQDIAFDKEISILSSIKHDNIVSIVGFCDENNEMIVVNKREARGSLNMHLNGSRLTWMNRLKISIGAAGALSYLHNDVGHNHYSVIHHNINSTSILLDENLEAKLSGFEYSKTIPAGHVDLVYEKLGIGTYKSDVFSFGIVLFEIMCGTKSFTTKEHNDKFQASLAIFNYESRQLRKLVDPDLFKQMDMQSFNIFSETAYYCLDQQAPPNMNQVLKRLNKALEAQQRHENKEQSREVHEGPSSNHLKLKLKNLEHMRIPFKDIELATGNFAPENCIVSGGFGTVYKAELEHIDREYCFAIERENEHELPKRRSQVAIKRIFNTEDEFGEQGFYTEIEMLTRIKDSNILTLLGFCDEGTVMILIYEYASNGSLVDYLQNTSNIQNDSWVQRIKICLDAAKGLSRLHTSEGDRQEIVHRDIKSANILLGKNMDAKIGDFGLSKFLYVTEDPNTLYSRKIPGTKVYKDPQYAIDGKLKIESDVYSFGVVLCEILCGRLAYHPVYTRIKDNGLAAIARQHFSRGTVNEILDPKIKEETTKTVFASVKGPNQDSLYTFLQIALQCLEETQTNRPTMERVIQEIEKAIIFQENRKDIFKISLEDIKLATENFSAENLIKEGGFGNVYKGEVLHANGISRVAVRRLDTRYVEEDGLSNELKVLMEHKHENVIGLVGYCDEMDEKIIVYDYASNGFLDLYLKKASLTWEKRLKICIDIAKGLDFLHGDAVTQDMVIHRDVKSRNILLDGDMKAKIGDFGRSIICPINMDKVFYTDKIVGTQSYIAPEYMSSGLLSKECDIYSFGIVLFEVMLRRLAFSREFEKEGFLGALIKNHFNEGKLEEVMFEGTNEHIAPQSLSTFQRIAIQCLHDNREERPTAGEVAMQLKKALEIQEKGTGIVRIPFEDIKSATNNFSNEYLIGKGGFGNVYLVEVTRANEQILIVAKRLDRKLGQGDSEFNKEIEILSKFRHKNVIGLEGYCDEMKERIIVYERASRSSLDRWVNNEDLSWVKRLEICIDVANGLNFLHGGVLRQEAVIHRDIKSANILLKDDWSAKITGFGVSLINPINQEMEQSSVAIGYLVGTMGYTDPVFHYTGLYTKESDIYSLGVVLLEILCGELVNGKVDYQEGFLTSLFKRRYEKGKLDEIVFQALQEQIVQQSLTIFSDIAYACVQHERKNRPTATEVVLQLKKALEFQEDHEMWEPKLPTDYKEIIWMSENPSSYFTIKKEDLYDMFFKGILIQKGNMLFSLDHNGERNEMISAMLFSYENQRLQKRRHMRISRFPRVSMMLDISDLNIKIQIKPQFLSPGVIYGVYLVFKFGEPNKISSKSMYVNLKYRKGNQTRHAYFASWRDDKWMKIELYQFLNQKDYDDDDYVLLESFSRYYCGSGAIYIEGIEFRAMHNIDKLAEINELNDDELCQTSKDPEKGGKGGKQYMMFAEEFLYDSSSIKLLNSRSLDESRSPEMFELLSQQVFRIKCKVKSQMLSPDTDYMCYLVFKLSEKCRGLQCPVKVRDLLRRNNKETQIIYFRNPTPWNLHDFIHVPKQRGDGWMEVKLLKFNSNSDAKNECIPVKLKLICYEGTMSGLIVSGLEFRPA